MNEKVGQAKTIVKKRSKHAQQLLENNICRRDETRALNTVLYCWTIKLLEEKSIPIDLPKQEQSSYDIANIPAIL